MRPPGCCELCGSHELIVLSEDRFGWVVKCSTCRDTFVIYRDI